jgi:hypothetical protein
MKRLTCMALGWLLMAGLGVSGAHAYTFLNNTPVQPYYLTNPATGQAGYWGSVWCNTIGDPGLFNIAGADFSNHTLTLYSNWPGPGTTDLGAVTADLFLSSNPGTSTWDFAVGLGDNGRGNIYKNPAFNTSQNIFGGNGGVVYGGAWDQSGPKPVPVQVKATSPAEVNTATVTWSLSGGIDPKYQVVVDLSNLAIDGLSLNNFEFLWASATCSNDVIEGTVSTSGGPGPAPAPPTLLLLGSGLAGLAFYRRRRATAKS